MQIVRWLMTLSLLLFISCENSDAKPKQITEFEDEAATDHSEDTLEIHSFTVSCGSGCAMIYSEEEVSALPNDDEWKVKFKVQLFVNEVLSDTYDQSYVFEGDAQHGSSRIYSEKDHTSIENDLTPELVEALKSYSEGLFQRVHFTSVKSSENGTIYSKVYAESGVTTLPLSYSYEFILELPNFRQVQGCSEMNEFEGLMDLSFSKIEMPNHSPILLVAGYMPSGQSEIYVLTLNNEFEPIDKVLLYSNQEIEEGAISTTFSIDENCTIVVSKDEITDRAKTNLEKTSYRILSSGVIRKRVTN